MFMHWTLSSRGFSLIEVLIVSAVMAITGLAVMSLFKSQLDANSFIEAQSKANQKAWEVSIILRNPIACNANMAALSSRSFDTTDPNATIPINSIFRTVGDPVAQLGITSADGIRVDTLQIRSINAIGGPGRYVGRLQIGMNISKSGLNKNFVRDVDFTFNATVVGNIATITSCGGSAFDDLRICMECARTQPDNCDAYNFECSPLFNDWADWVRTGGASWRMKCRSILTSAGAIVNRSCGRPPYTVP